MKKASYLSLSLSAIVASSVLTTTLVSCKADGDQNKQIGDFDFNIQAWPSNDKLLEGINYHFKILLSNQNLPSKYNATFSIKTQNQNDGNLITIDNDELLIKDTLSLGSHGFTITCVVNCDGYITKSMNKDLTCDIVDKNDPDVQKPTITISGDNEYTSYYNDSFSTKNYVVLYSGIATGEVSEDDISWTLQSSPDFVNINDIGQVYFSTGYSGEHSYTFSIVATLISDNTISSSKEITLNTTDKRPQPTSAKINGPLVVHALKGYSSSEFIPNKDFDHNVVYNFEVSPGYASSDVNWSLVQGTTTETTENPYHTEYHSDKSNNLVPNWLHIDGNTGQLSWDNEVQAASDPLIGRYLNWRITVRAILRDYQSLYWDYSINFMVSKRSDGWVLPTEVQDIKSPGWMNDFDISTPYQTGGEKQYYANCDAGGTVLETDVFQGTTWNLIENPSFVNINEYGKLIWTTDNIPGTYSFKIKATSTKDTTLYKEKTINFTVSQPSTSDSNNSISNYLNKINDYYQKITPVFNHISRYGGNKPAAVIQIINSSVTILNNLYSLYDLCYKTYNGQIDNDSQLRTLYNTIKTLGTNQTFIDSIIGLLTDSMTIANAFRIIFNSDLSKIKKTTLPPSMFRSISPVFLLASVIFVFYMYVYMFLIICFISFICSLYQFPLFIIWLLLF